jgi:hypothetical protein
MKSVLGPFIILAVVVVGFVFVAATTMPADYNRRPGLQDECDKVYGKATRIRRIA